MRRRLSLARDFAAEALLLLLDEPFAFLDAPWRRTVARMIDVAAANGASVLFSTHQSGDNPAVMCRTLTIGEGGNLIFPGIGT